MERLVEERKKRMADRKKQRKEDRRNAFYRQKEEEAQRIHEEQLKKGKLLACVFYETPPAKGESVTENHLLPKKQTEE